MPPPGGGGGGLFEQAQREPHGIKYEKDPADGIEYLYHTNNGWNDSYGEDIGKNGWDDPSPHTFVAKTDLGSGTVLWQTFLDADWAKKNGYPKYGRTRLTDVIPLPGTDYLLVTDGYGSSCVTSHPPRPAPPRPAPPRPAPSTLSPNCGVLRDAGIACGGGRTREARGPLGDMR